jgi:hypothetical protein
MPLSLPFSAEWAHIKKQKQDLNNKGVERKNSERTIEQSYHPGDHILLTKPRIILPKMSQPQTGPFEVI